MRFEVVHWKLSFIPGPASHSVSFIYLDHGGTGRAPRALPPPQPPSSPWLSPIKGFSPSHHLTISCTNNNKYRPLSLLTHWLINLVRYQNTSRNSNFIIISYLMDIVTQYNIPGWRMNIPSWDKLCWQYCPDFDLVLTFDTVKCVIYLVCEPDVTSVCLHDVMWCLMLLISYFDWADLSTASPHISAYLYTFLSSARKCRPPPHLPVSRQGNAPLIMGTCPPNSSRHLTSKQTFVGCRVIGAPASRCKLDTSPVGTNIGSPGGILKCPSTHYN